MKQIIPNEQMTVGGKTYTLDGTRILLDVREWVRRPCCTMHVSAALFLNGQIVAVVPLSQGCASDAVTSLHKWLAANTDVSELWEGRPFDFWQSGKAKLHFPYEVIVSERLKRERWWEQSYPDAAVVEL